MLIFSFYWGGLQKGPEVFFWANFLHFPRGPKHQKLENKLFFPLGLYGGFLTRVSFIAEKTQGFFPKKNVFLNWGGAIFFAFFKRLGGCVGGVS